VTDVAGATGREGLVRGGKVRPHVQAFADDCARATGAQSFGTYPGHQPSQDRALDIFHRIGDHALADRICDFYVANWRQYGGDYIISRRRIWNPEVSPNWRPMGDRGGPTQNHEDHAHVSFEPTAPPSPTPGPPPDNDPLRLSGQLVVIFEGD